MDQAFLSGQRRYTVAGADRRPALVRHASVSTAACTTRAAAAASSRSTSSPGAWLTPAAFRTSTMPAGRRCAITPASWPAKQTISAASAGSRLHSRCRAGSPPGPLQCCGSGPGAPRCRPGRSSPRAVLDLPVHQGQARPGRVGALARGHARGHGELVPASASASCGPVARSSSSTGSPARRSR